MSKDSSQRLQQGERLKQARHGAGFKTAIAAVEKFGFKPQSTYLARENGQNGISADAAIAYGKAYNVDPGWILTGVGRGPSAKGGKAIAKQPDSEGYTPIGRFDASFSMGPGALVPDQPEPLGYWMIETQWLNGLTRAAAEHLAIVRTTGDSMLPTLQKDDWVLVDMLQRRITREGIYAIRVGDDVWVKRISLNLKTKAVRVISDNPTTPPQPDLDEGDVQIIGRVVALVARQM